MKVYLIQQAQVWWPKKLLFENAKLTEFEPVSLGGILVEHPSEGYVLVDNGLMAPGQGEVEKYLPLVGSLVPAPLKNLGVKLNESVPLQLKNHGIDLRDVKHVVFTHLHNDHVGDISYYPNARVWVSQAELRMAKGPLGFLKGYSPQIFQWDYRIETIPNSFVFENDVAPFAILKDFFKDGSVVALSTPGHTSGSISVLVRSEEKKFLLCGDACYCRRSYREGIDPGGLGPYKADQHRKLAQDTRKKIKEWEAHDESLKVIPLHDSELWGDSPLFPQML